MSRIIDRRFNNKNKSAVNRRRFLHRFRHQIKKAVTDAIGNRSILDIDKGEHIIIPKKDTSEPIIRHSSQGGKRKVVHPGNEEFLTGDKIKRPPQSDKGKGSEASNEGEGEDEFAFEISREEFLELFFEDLELPDLIKRQMTQLPTTKWVRAGVTTCGVPTNLNIVRSFKQATARRIAVLGPYRKKLRDLTRKLEECSLTLSESDPNIQALKDEIAHIKRRMKSIPFFDTFDLRYNNRIQKPVPTTQAVMFCLMDVSGSMDEAKKDIAKRFFILLYLFLTRNYEKIDVVFIRHHTSAKEVDEKEFFYSRETGGTVVSSALELMKDIIAERYPSSAWNIYAAQASDGDNWNADSPYCHDLLLEQIMPLVQYYAYVEIMPRHHQSLWQAYAKVKENCKHFSMQHISGLSEIYPVFRELFKRKSA